MKVVSLTAQIVRLPFRFSFKHSLASRSVSDNLIVCAKIAHGGREFIGYGESIPRDYVTGEDVDSALVTIREQYFPRFSGRAFETADHLRTFLQEQFLDLQLERKAKGASWCALELALLDAAARAQNMPFADWLGGVRSEHIDGITYGGVIPFGKKRAFTAVLWFYKFFGFNTVKIKVGTDFEGDLERVKLARSILGPDVILRADANCAWNADETIRRAEELRKFNVVSYEQPVPAEDLDGLSKISRAIPELVMVDESLCSIADARRLADEKICTAFNIRVSKVGGVLAAAEIAKIAREAGIAIQMGAQVGESGILSSAGRAFASSQPKFDNCEGSNNFFLLKRDLTAENLNVGLGGVGTLLRAPGLGVSVVPERLHEMTVPDTSVPNRLMATGERT